MDVLDRVSFEILRREEQLEAAKLDGVLTAVLRVPDLRVGDELEVSLTTRLNDPTLGPLVSGLLVLAPDPLPGRYRLGLSWEPGEEPHVQMTASFEAIAQRQPQAITLDFDNPGPISLPIKAPGRYVWDRALEYSDFPDWAAVSRRFAPLYLHAATLGRDSELKQEARRIAESSADPMQRLKTAVKLVQQEVRYIYVGLDGGNFKPATAQETWQRRYGDCKAKVALLMALLRELGIDAEPVLVSNGGIDDGFDERLPNPGLFDHVVVRAHVNGDVYWADGTLPGVAEPSAAPVNTYRWVLPLTKEGAPLEHLEWRPPERPDSVTLFEIDARAGFDQMARITRTTIVRGVDGLQQQLTLSGLTSAQLLNSLRQQGGDTWHTIENAEWRYDTRAQASILTISGLGTVAWQNSSQDKKTLSLPGGGFSPPERLSRPIEQKQDLPYYSQSAFNCHVTTVRLPEATKMNQWSYNSSFDTRIFGKNYYRVFEIRDNTIRMIRGLRVEQQEIDAASAQMDNARIEDFDNSMAVITYNPARTQPPPRGSAQVPATYELDWTADRVPCLAANSLN